MNWQKPSEKFCNDGACAEVTCGGAGVLLRASGVPEAVVELTREEFSAFVQAVKAGEYDGYVL